MQTFHPCTCPHEERSLRRLYGISMGRGIVRISTTPHCPEHDSCHGWTKAARIARIKEASWSTPWCPKHGTNNCPEGRL